MKSGAIDHGSGVRFLILRQDFVEICDGSFCAAGVLRVFEYWHDIKAGNVEQEKARSTVDLEHTPDLSVWIYRSYESLAEDMLGLYGRSKICDALKLLHSKGYIESEEDPNNPYNRTLRYRLMAERVNFALAGWRAKKPHSPELDDASSTSGRCTSSSSGPSHRPVLDPLLKDLNNRKSKNPRRSLKGGLNKFDPNQLLSTVRG